MARRSPPPRRSREPAHRINRRIDAKEVRLVGEENEEMNGVIPLDRALEMARERGVDVVEIASKATPPVVRLVEYSRFKYEQKKKEKDNKAKQHKVEIKEIRFGPNTDEHDFQFKKRHAEEFLKQGNKVKAFVVFHGRSIVHSDRGRKLLHQFSEELSEVSKVEMAPKLEGKRMFLMLAPLAKK